MAHRVAQVARVTIALVLPPGDARIGEGFPQLLPGKPQQGPHHLHAQAFALGRHAGKARQPRAAQQVQQQRFRLIVPVMGQGHGLRAAAAKLLTEKTVARLSGPILPRMLRRVGAIHGQGQAFPFAQFPDKALVLVRLRAPQAMVDMHRPQPDPALRPQAQKQLRQRHGIRPAGQADEQPFRQRGQAAQQRFGHAPVPVRCHQGRDGAPQAAQGFRFL